MKAPIGEPTSPSPVAPLVPVSRLAGSDMSVVVLDDLAALARYVSAWEELVSAALEPNVFYEPWVLLPAVGHLRGTARLRFVLIFAPDRTRRHGPPILCGLFPLERTRLPHSPIGLIRLWRHWYCSLCTPLLRADRAHDCLMVFLDWLASNPETGALVELEFITADGPFYQVLVDCLNQRRVPLFVSDCFTRALFRPSADPGVYVRAALSGKRRKEVLRQANRLAELGRVDYVALEPKDDPVPWIEDFLRLEAAGWKGREGSALASRPTDRDFFVRVATEAARRGRLMMLSLRLDGRPIACKCSFRAEPGSFAFKICYDESYARFSPGLHLEIENVRRLHNTPGIEWMDSCAVRDHFMINRLWLQRRTIQTVVVPTGKAPGGLLVALLPLLRWVNRGLHRGRATTPGSGRDGEVDGRSGD